MGTAAGILGQFEWFPMTREMLRMLVQGNDLPDQALTQRDLKVPSVSFASWLQNGLMQPHSGGALEAPTVTRILSVEESEVTPDSP